MMMNDIPCYLVRRKLIEPHSKSLVVSLWVRPNPAFQSYLWVSSCVILRISISTRLPSEQGDGDVRKVVGWSRSAVKLARISRTSGSVAAKSLFVAVPPPILFPFLTLVRTGLLSPGSKTSGGKS